MKKILKFPKDFLWGSSISAYQVEGGIENNDFSKFFPAKKACNHYFLYEKDFSLLKKLNQNAFRFSIEWSRIEPEEGKFSKKETQHYQKVILALKKRKIKVMVTLHHFTNPFWLKKINWWEGEKVVFYFSRFARYLFSHYKDLVDFWITINEPLVYGSLAYLKGRWPPFKKNFFSFFKVFRNQIKAHKEVYCHFHQIKKDVKIGISKNNQFFEPEKNNSFLDKLSTKLIDYFWNEYFLNQIKNHLDFIGLNYYFHNKIKFPFKIKNENKIVSDLGWGIYPKGIYFVLKKLKKYQKPIYITENGVADKNDLLREKFIKDHLFWVAKAIEEGVPVKGYFYWSLLDNFEWDQGFEARFGLVEVDYQTFKRILRKSALFYQKICKNNFLEV